MTIDDVVLEEVTQLVQNLNSIDAQIKEKESLRDLIRQRLEVIVEQHGDISIDKLCTVKVIQESSSVSFDNKEVQRVLDMLLQRDLFEYASALAKAKKEQSRKKSLRIVKWKEKA